MNKPKTTQKEIPNEVQGRDLFQTPNYAIDLLIPFIPKNIKEIWEPATGHGKIVKALQSAGFGVYSSDINFDIDWVDETWNFLRDEVYYQFKYLNSPAIITNPPFSLKKRFFFQCLGYNVPFALLIPFEMSSWVCDAFDKYDCQGLVPKSRINYITPNGLQGKESSAKFHSFWLTYKFNLPKQLTFVELTNKEKENI